VKVRGDQALINKLAKDEYAFGWYSWTDRQHIVRSPMAVSLA